jgi:hypothetical protein
MNLDTRTITDEELTALHEAGHVVAHFAVDWPAAAGTIVPTEEYLGQVTFDPDAKRPDGNLEAMVFAAGHIAVDLMLCGCWVHRTSDYPDFAAARLAIWCKHFPRPQLSPEREAAVNAHVEALAQSIGSARLVSLWALFCADEHPDRMPFIEVRLAGVCRSAAGLLLRLWPRVVAVADALLDRKTLTGEEIAAVLQAPESATLRGIPPRKTAAELRRAGRIRRRAFLRTVYSQFPTLNSPDP